MFINSFSRPFISSSLVLIMVLKNLLSVFHSFSYTPGTLTYRSWKIESSSPWLPWGKPWFPFIVQLYPSFFMNKSNQLLSLGVCRINKSKETETLVSPLVYYLQLLRHSILKDLLTVNVSPFFVFGNHIRGSRCSVGLEDSYLTFSSFYL